MPRTAVADRFLISACMKQRGSGLVPHDRVSTQLLGAFYKHAKRYYHTHPVNARTFSFGSSGIL